MLPLHPIPSHSVAGDLAEHVDSVGIKWMQLCFRWMNCLLLRELPHRLALRLWDTLLCEEDGFETFHVYVCATLMVEFADHVKTLDFAVCSGVSHSPVACWSCCGVAAVD